MNKPRKSPPAREAANYTHPRADLALRPEVGTQAQFKKHRPPQTYRYDSSLSPVLEWDSQNPAREQGERLIAALAECGIRIAELAKQPASAKRDAELARLQSEIGNLKSQIQKLSRPFLNWTGKAERLSFDVPTLPLFVHERLSTRAIIETLTGHRRDQNLDFMAGLFGDPRHSVSDQVLRAYEYREGWVNRMVLGDSLAVMNSLLRYESLGGQVQMIYLDPPYGVKFGSNFQPFVRKRDVSHGDDADMTREPEMVQAYRDTWELGLHSYLTYLRDRLLLARELLHPSGSIFVQISDDNLHHVRELMDEVFGAENFCAEICFAKTSGRTPRLLPQVSDYLVWYAKDKERTKYRPLFEPRPPIENPKERYICVETADGKLIDLSLAQKQGKEPIPEGRLLRLQQATSQGESPADRDTAVVFEGRKFFPPKGRHWSVTPAGMQRVVEKGRAYAVGTTLTWKSYRDEFPFRGITDNWSDGIGQSGFGDEKLYVVQTNVEVVKRCLLMTTDPGDLVLDPTCGSGTTAYVAEQWGRRWITCDTSRVPLALARQRLLTATFPWFQINPVAADVRRLTSTPGKDQSLVTSAATEAMGNPSDGFIYKRRQNNKGEEVGGIVPHITLKSIANNEPPAEEVLVDRPEELKSITRVCGPFVVEATIPTAQGVESEQVGGGESGRAGVGTGSPAHSPAFPPAGSAGGDYAAHTARMLEVLRKSPVLRLDGNKTVTFRNIRPPAKTLVLSAEALVAGSSRGNEAQTSAPKSQSLLTSAATEEEKPVAFLFGPENGAVSERLVAEAAREAWGKNYSRLYVIGFAIEAKARETVENCEAVFNVPATYVQATPDLLMGDLLKNMRSSQIFSVCGAPEISVSKVQSPKSKAATGHEPRTTDHEQFQVELLGLDVFDPITMEVTHRSGADVPAWFLDTDYNGRVFHVTQAFFPRTGAWESLKKALKGDYDETVWDHLAGTVSAPFTPGEHRKIAVKVIDDRGNELLVVKKLKEGK